MGNPPYPTARLIFIDKDPLWAGVISPATTTPGILKLRQQTSIEPFFYYLISKSAGSKEEHSGKCKQHQEQSEYTLHNPSQVAIASITQALLSRVFLNNSSWIVENNLLPFPFNSYTKMFPLDYPHSSWNKNAQKCIGFPFLHTPYLFLFH